MSGSQLRGLGPAAGGGSYDPDPLTKVPAPPGGKPTPRMIRPGWLDKNRDWNIPIECERDAVVIRVINERIPLDKLSTDPDNALLKAVTQLIDRRQKMVPPGVPPWRPIVKFQVHVDGSRAYFFAYPTLERLPYPKVREDLDLEDVKKRENVGR